MAGSQFNFKANSRIIMVPSQKEGMLENSRAIARVALSIREYCRTADRMPMGMAIKTVITQPPKAIINVVGSLVIISLKTGRWVL